MSGEINPPEEVRPQAEVTSPSVEPKVTNSESAEPTATIVTHKPLLHGVNDLIGGLIHMFKRNPAKEAGNTTTGLGTASGTPPSEPLTLPTTDAPTQAAETEAMEVGAPQAPEILTTSAPEPAAELNPTQPTPITPALPSTPNLGEPPVTANSPAATIISIGTNSGGGDTTLPKAA